MLRREEQEHHITSLHVPSLCPGSYRHVVLQGLCSYTAVPVSSEGLVSADDVVAAMTPQTVLVSIMHRCGCESGV